MSDIPRPPLAETDAEQIPDDTFTALNLILALVRRRRLIVLTTSIAAVVVLAYNILAMTVIDPWASWNVLPTWFKASVTVRITDDGESGQSGPSAASMMSEFPANPLMTGGVGKNAALAKELLIGPEILDALAKQQGFITDASDGTEIYNVRKRLKKSLATLDIFNSDLVVISYEHFYPEEAASGLTFAVAQVRAKVHRLLIDRVHSRRVFLGDRMVAIEQEREIAQDKMIDFQQEFGVVNWFAQSKASVDNLTRMKTQLYTKEAELLSQIKIRGDNAASVKRLRVDVDTLNTVIREMEHGFVELTEQSTPLMELPALGARYLKLATELAVLDSVYSSLRSQYENTRIEENSQEATFQIVEPVQVPLHKSRPSRALICMVGTLAAFVLSLLAAFTLERLKSDPAQRRQLEELRAEISAMRKRTGTR